MHLDDSIQLPNRVIERYKFIFVYAGILIKESGEEQSHAMHTLWPYVFNDWYWKTFSSIMKRFILLTNTNFQNNLLLNN